MELFAWLFIVTIGMVGTTLVACNFIVMATDSERLRWYVAVMRKIGRRIGLEL